MTSNVKMKIVMLPTDKPSPLVLNLEGDLEYDEALSTYGGVYQQHLYVLSDEEIKEGEWAIASNNTNGIITDFKGCKPFKAKSDYAASIYVLKIMSTTDKSLIRCQCGKQEHKLSCKRQWELPQLPQAFIDKYVKEYNNKNQITEVEVEHVHLCKKCGMRMRDFGCIANCGKEYVKELDTNPRTNTIRIKDAD